MIKTLLSSQQNFKSGKPPQSESLNRRQSGQNSRYQPTTKVQEPMIKITDDKDLKIEKALLDLNEL